MNKIFNISIDYIDEDKNSGDLKVGESQKKIIIKKELFGAYKNDIEKIKSSKGKTMSFYVENTFTTRTGREFGMFCGINNGEKNDKIFIKEEKNFETIEEIEKEIEKKRLEIEDLEDKLIKLKNKNKKINENMGKFGENEVDKDEFDKLLYGDENEENEFDENPFD